MTEAVSRRAFRARARKADKRGGGWIRSPLDASAVVSENPAIEILAMNDALEKLSMFDDRRARIVELRFFGGLDIEETAGVLDVSVATVQREWRLAKAWLRRELEQVADDEH